MTLRLSSAVVGELKNADGVLGLSLETLLVRIITRSESRRAGFVYEGTMRSHGVWAGERCDVLWFAALPLECPAGGGT